MRKGRNEERIEERKIRRTENMKKGKYKKGKL